jgi:hypothetical protein
MQDVPDIASVNHPSWPLLLALAGDTGEAARRLEAFLEVFGDRVQDSEWLPEMVQAAFAAIILRHRNAAAAIYSSLAQYGDLFAIEGIGAATWGCVHGYLGPPRTRARSKGRFAAPPRDCSTTGLRRR